LYIHAKNEKVLNTVKRKLKRCSKITTHMAELIKEDYRKVAGFDIKDYGLSNLEN